MSIPFSFISIGPLIYQGVLPPLKIKTITSNPSKLFLILDVSNPNTMEIIHFYDNYYDEIRKQDNNSRPIMGSLFSEWNENERDLNDNPILIVSNSSSQSCYEGDIVNCNFYTNISYYKNSIIVTTHVNDVNDVTNVRK